METQPNITSAAQAKDRQRVVIVGGGVAALETALALAQLAPGLLETTLIAPNRELVYRPMTVREPFSYAPARRYALAPIAKRAGAELMTDELLWVDRRRQVLHTHAGAEIEYDALVLALGANAKARYEHAITIDDRRLDEALHGLIQDVESGYVKRLAFVSPGRMAWPLPLYELALMTAGRAYEMGMELETTVITPEDGPLAIFGSAASAAVAELLARSRIRTIHSAYAEVPRSTEVVVNPGDRRLRVDRVVALPELYGPTVEGVPHGSHGFLRIDQHGALVGANGIYAAGDATEFAVKHGGIGCQQADAVAESIAAAAGAPIVPRPFHPQINGILLTGSDPLYLTARITGGHGFSSEVIEQPSWQPPHKIAARYLAPVLDSLDRELDAANT